MSEEAIRREASAPVQVPGGVQVGGLGFREMALRTRFTLESSGRPWLAGLTQSLHVTAVLIITWNDAMMPHVNYMSTSCTLICLWARISSQRLRAGKGPRRPNPCARAPKLITAHPLTAGRRRARAAAAFMAAYALNLLWVPGYPGTRPGRRRRTPGPPAAGLQAQVRGVRTSAGASRTGQLEMHMINCNCASQLNVGVQSLWCL